MKAGVVLSGCGYMDGSEIHEAVFTLLHLDLAGVEVQCMSPEGNQLHVVNHISNEICKDASRDMLLESARIARGNIVNISSINVADIDVLVFPGGFGAAKNLCTFATDGATCRVNKQVEEIINKMLDAHKPIGALCIAPALLARVTGKTGLQIKVTIGNDREVAEAIHAMGALHVDCPVSEAIIDETHKIVTSPAYMLAQSIKDVSESAHALVKGLMTLV